MFSYVPPWQRRPKPTPRPAGPQPSLAQQALAALKQAEEGDPPFGGWAGETAIPKAEPAPPPPVPLVIPAPDWEQEERLRAEAERAAEPEPALAEEQPTPHPPPRREPA